MHRNHIQVQTKKITNQLTYGKTTVVTYEIMYPQFQSEINPNFINRLNRHYQSVANQQVAYCQKNLYPQAVQLYRDSVRQQFPFHEYTFNSAFTVTYNDSRKVSLYSDQGMYTGGANGTTIRRAESWHVQKGKAITLQDLFPEQQQLNIYLQQKIIKDIERQMQRGNGTAYFEDYKKLVPQYYDPKNFYMVSAGVVLYFQETTIAPHSTGIPTFGVPTQQKISKTMATGMDTPNPYQIKSNLFMEATNAVGVVTPEAAVTVWAQGIQKRNGALQYCVLTESYKPMYAKRLNQNNPNWVTGVSSPWVESFHIEKKKTVKEAHLWFRVKFDMATSEGFWANFYAELTVVQEGQFWRISHIRADEELGLFP